MSWLPAIRVCAAGRLRSLLALALLGPLSPAARCADGRLNPGLNTDSRTTAGSAGAIVPVQPGREIRYDLALAFDPGAPSVSLRERPRLYAYSLVNRSDRDVPGPVPYRKYLWVSVPDLFRTAGFNGIHDELKLAKAIHAFVSEYTVQGGQVMEAGVFRDPLKYLVHYGEGICHASATAQAVLMELAGLRSRIWWLSGHVVPETFAGGAWRLLDPDHKKYFYAKNDRDAVYSVEDLAADRRRFDRYVSVYGGASGAYPGSNREIYLSTGDNLHFDAVKSGADTAFRYTLRPGEKIVFTNFNWGRYVRSSVFTGAPLHYYNGYFEYAADPSRIRAGEHMAVSGAGGKLELRNEGESEPGYAEIAFASPFPVVGGAVRASLSEKEGEVSFVLAAPSGSETLSFFPVEGENRFDWDSGLQSPGPFPAFSYTFRIKLSPGGRVRLSGLSVITDFQYGRLALLELGKGKNSFKVNFPDGVTAGHFLGEVLAAY